MSIGNPNQIKKFVILLAFILGFFGAVNAQKMGEISDEEWNLVPPEGYEEAPAVIIFDRGYLTMEYDGDSKMIRHWRAKIFDSQRASDILAVEVPYYEGTKIKKLKAYTILPDGTKKEVKDFEKDKSEDRKVITFTFAGFQNGAVVEYYYEQTMPLILFFRAWGFQNEYLTLNSHFSLIIPCFLSSLFKTKANNIPYFQKDPVVDTVKTDERRTWDMANLEPIVDEPYQSARGDRLYTIDIMIEGWQGNNWCDLGLYLDSSYAEMLDFEDIQKEFSDSLCSGLTNNLEKVQAVFNFVRKNIGTETTRPPEYDVKKVLEHKYAVPYVKSYLLISMLRTLGIKANGFMIGTRDEHAPFSTANHTMDQFNKMLCQVEVDSQIIYLDPNDKLTDLPYMPARNLVQGGLLLDGKNSKACPLKPIERKNRKAIATNISVDGAGTAFCTTTVFINGYPLDDYKYLADDTTTDQTVKGLLSSAVDYECEISNFQSVYLPEDDKLNVEIIYEIPAFAQAVDSGISFNPFVCPIKKNPFVSERRRYPIDFNYEFTEKQMISVKLPDTMVIAEIPQDIFHTIEGGKFRRTSTGVNNTLSIQTAFEIKQPFYETKFYKDVKGLFEAAESAGSDKAVAKPKPTPAE